MCSKYMLQLPKYCIIIVNRFRHCDKSFLKNRCLVHPDLIFMIGSYQFSLQATIMDILCIVLIKLLLSTAARKHFIAIMTKLLYVI